MRLHALLARPGMHLLLGARTTLPGRAVAGPFVHVHRLPARPDDVVVAVRPDGHIGFRGRPDDALARWLDRVGAPGVGA
jgi:hypothetical protein